MRTTRRLAVDGKGRRETRIIALALPLRVTARVRVTAPPRKVPCRSLLPARSCSAGQPITGLTYPPPGSRPSTTLTPPFPPIRFLTGFFIHHPSDKTTSHLQQPPPSTLHRHISLRLPPAATPPFRSAPPSTCLSTPASVGTALQLITSIFITTFTTTSLPKNQRWLADSAPAACAR